MNNIDNKFSFENKNLNESQKFLQSEIEATNENIKSIESEIFSINIELKNFDTKKDENKSIKKFGKFKSLQNSELENNRNFFDLQRKISALNAKKNELVEYHQNLVERIEVAQPPAKKKGFLSKTILNIIYPATTLYSEKALKQKEDKLTIQQKVTAKDEVSFYSSGGEIIKTSIQSEISKNVASKVSFLTEDNKKLEGCIIYSNSYDHNLKNKKIMVMALGNAFTWQQGYLHAKLMSEKYDCNVLIYNPRGIGKSTGATETMHDAVTDCKAAIEFALNKSSSNINKKNYQNLAVYGHSLGGGISAVALQEMIKEEKIDKEGIGLYINHHSFSSLSGFTKGLGKYAKPLGGISRFILKALGHDRLTSKRTILDTKLATKVVVATGEKDEMMGKAARLMESLKKEEFSTTKKIANNIMYVTIPDYGHHEEEEYLIDKEKLAKKEKENELDDITKEKLVQLKNYDAAIQEWSKSKSN